MANERDEAGTISKKIAEFFSHRSTGLLVVVAILSLSVSFFTTGLIRVLLGLICLGCSAFILQRAIAKSVSDRWGPDKT
jgi:hypothetical protein